MFAVYIKILSITMPKLCLEKKFEKNSDISSETVVKFPKKKYLFKENILLNDDNTLDTYPENILQCSFGCRN